LIFAYLQRIVKLPTPTLLRKAPAICEKWENRYSGQRIE